jgi:hypothetical protein
MLAWLLIFNSYSCFRQCCFAHSSSPSDAPVPDPRVYGTQPSSCSGCSPSFRGAYFLLAKPPSRQQIHRIPQIRQPNILPMHGSRHRKRRTPRLNIRHRLTPHRDATRDEDWSPKLFRDEFIDEVGDASISRLLLMIFPLRNRQLMRELNPLRSFVTLCTHPAFQSPGHRCRGGPHTAAWRSFESGPPVLQLAVSWTQTAQSEPEPTSLDPDRRGTGTQGSDAALVS